MATITKGAETTMPTLITGLEARREARTVLHPVIGRPVPEVTLRASAPRSGTLTLHYSSLAEARSCVDLHANDPAPLTLDDEVYGELRYVVAGAVALVVAVAGVSWSVEVDYQEVPE